MLGRISKRVLGSSMIRGANTLQWRAASMQVNSFRSFPSTSPFTMNSMSRNFSSEATVVEEGTQPSLEWRAFFEANGKRISPWHDISLKGESGHFNYVNEINIGQRAKMEVTLDEPGNPIKQDVKKGALRFFTYGDSPFNYGCIPQTWENPHAIHEGTGLKGDGDPVDVVEISQEPLGLGTVAEIKLLGVMALIDEGETDWKVLGIAKSNPLFDKINNEADIERELPGLVATVRDWFKMYKTTDGKPENEFAFDGAVKDVAYTLEVVDECHESYNDLVQGKNAEADKDLVLN